MFASLLVILAAAAAVAALLGIAAHWFDRVRAEGLRVRAEQTRLLEATVNDAIATGGRSLALLADASLLARVNLPPKEALVWIGRVRFGQIATRTTAVRHSGVGARIRIAKGVYWRAGETKVQRIRRDVFEVKASGILMVTSGRMTFISDNPAVPNWSKTWAAIAGHSVYTDAVQIDPASGKAVFFLPEAQGVLSDPRVIEAAIELAPEAADAPALTSYTASSPKASSEPAMPSLVMREVGGASAGIALVLIIVGIASPSTGIGLALLLGAGGAFVFFDRTTTDRWARTLTCAAMLAGVVGLATGVGASMVRAELQAARQADADSANEAARVALLRASAPDRLRRVTALLANEQRIVDEMDFAAVDTAFAELAPIAELAPPAEGFVEIGTRVDALQERVLRRAIEIRIAEYDTLVAEGDWRQAREPASAAQQLASRLGDAAEIARTTDLHRRGEPYWTALDKISAAHTVLESVHADPIAAEDAYDAVLSDLDGFSDDVARVYARELRSVRASLQAKRSRNSRSASRLRDARAREAAQLLLCGRAPSTTSLDGEVGNVESYVESVAHDPDSVEVENCSTPALSETAQRCWFSTCLVRGRNGFGAMRASRWEFEFRHGLVASHREVR